MTHVRGFDKIFETMYGDKKEELNRQTERYARLVQKFGTKFGPAEIHFFSTPGRTEIGGNHTDHNLGRVLAGSVNLDSVAAAAKTESAKIQLYSDGFPGVFEVDLSRLERVDAERGTTTALIRGIASRFQQLGLTIGGFNAWVHSEVLQGSGLSSSASIEVLIGTILNYYYNDGAVAPEKIAMVGQYAENEYFGKPCGLMDQTACAVGGIITIDFKDPSLPVVKKVDFNFAAQHYSLVVVDTGGNHADLTDDYAAVPREMKSVAAALGGKVCRDLDMAQLVTTMRTLREKVGDRAIVRAIHFLQDNERVSEQVTALEQGDFHRFLELVNASGNSSFKWLQNIYTVKNVREQGVTLALALTEKYLGEIGAGACRVHGGGFAGTIQVFLPDETVAGYQRMMEQVFGDNSVKALSIRPVGTVHVGRLDQ
ncbi:MAG: galactokinase [Candidatus Zhuqueibacterota bacterium]